MPYLPIECEDLQVVSANGPQPEPVDMLNEGPDWSGGKQLCQPASEPGASFTVNLPPVESDGGHELTIRWTTGPEYGTVRLRANGPHDLAIIECYASVRGAKEIPVGTIQRQRNDNAQLTVDVIGKDRHATGAWVGLDWLAEKPAASGPKPQPSRSRPQPSRSRPEQSRSWPNRCGRDQKLCGLGRKRRGRGRSRCGRGRAIAVVAARAAVWAGSPAV